MRTLHARTEDAGATRLLPPAPRLRFIVLHASYARTHARGSQFRGYLISAASAKPSHEAAYIRVTESPGLLARAREHEGNASREASRRRVSCVCS